MTDRSDRSAVSSEPNPGQALQAPAADAERRKAALRRTLRCLSILCFAAASGLFAPQWGLARAYAYLGLGGFRSNPLFELLLRICCGLIGILGGALWIASADARRHATLVSFLVISLVVMAMSLVLIDVHQNMLWPWVLAGAPAVGLAGIVLVVLNVRCWGQ